jgi:hypothetical protein
LLWKTTINSTCDVSHHDVFTSCQRNLEKDLLTNTGSNSVNTKAQLKTLDTLTLEDMSMIEETPELRILKENFEKFKKQNKDSPVILMIMTILYGVICGL